MTVTDQVTARGARVVPIPPPLYYGAAFGAGLGLRAVTWPLPIGVPTVRVPVGVLLLVAGVAVAGAGVMSVVRHRTTIVPHHPVTTLLTTGIYRLSRNPMYVGLASAYLGTAVLVGSWWPVLTFPLALVAVRVVVVGPEENYLAEQFGAPFADYRRHVRRWV